jgi:hypothetical protein
MTINNEQKTDKLFYYECVKDCTFNGKRCRPGEILPLEELINIPHFKLVEKEEEKEVEEK